MKDELLSVLSKVATTQLALESLRAKDIARALELLGLDLYASILALARLSKEVAPAEGNARVAGFPPLLSCGMLITGWFL